MEWQNYTAYIWHRRIGLLNVLFSFIFIYFLYIKDDYTISNMYNLLLHFFISGITFSLLLYNIKSFISLMVVSIVCYTLTYNVTFLQLFFFNIISNPYFYYFTELDIKAKINEDTYFFDNVNIVNNSERTMQGNIYRLFFLSFLIPFLTSCLCIFLFYFYFSSLVSLKIELSNMYMVEVKNMEEYYKSEKEILELPDSKMKQPLFKNKKVDNFYHDYLDLHFAV